MLWSVLAWIGVAMAVDVPIPAPLGARSLDADTPCPTVPEDSVPRLVTTTVGPATHRGDGSYAWVCPLHWGGALRPVIASNPAGGVVVVVADGLLFRSTDGGCGFESVPLPGAEVEALTTFHWRENFWVVTTDATAQTTEVFQLQDAGLASFVELDDFIAQSAQGTGTATLWLAGLQPVPTVFRIGLTGGVSGEDEPLRADLPDSDRVSRLDVAAGDDDEVWILATRGTQRSFWFGQYLDTGVTLWEAPEGSYRSVQGPLKTQGLWLASLDGQLYTAGQFTGTFQSIGVSAPWTDLAAVGDRLFAGTPTELLAVTGFDSQLVPQTTPAFAMGQLARPVEACLIEGCAALLDEIAAADATIAVDAPAACPDGTTLDALQAEGCNCTVGGQGPAGVLSLFAGVVGAGIRRRSTPR